MGVFYFMYPKIIKSILRLMPFQFIYINVEFNWSVLDFSHDSNDIRSYLYFLISSKIINLKIRILSIILSILLFLIIWAELAVGIFDSPLAGN